MIDKENWLIKCRFGCTNLNPAIVLVELSNGCVAFPTDKKQWLCLHHFMRGMNQGFHNGGYKAIKLAPYVIAIEGVNL